MKKEGRETEALYRYTRVNDYDNPAHIFALDYYEPGSSGKDEFSKKEVWFYYMGGKDLKNEFSKRMEHLLDDLFVQNTVEWDYFTLAPSHDKNSLNTNMLDLCAAMSQKQGVEYRQVLRRKIDVEDSGEMSSIRQRVVNQEDSVEITQDVKGDNIIIVDNVSVSGVFLTFLTDLLLDAGAKRVCCVVIGVTNGIREVVRLDKGVTASTVIKGKNGGENNE